MPAAAFSDSSFASVRGLRELELVRGGKVAVEWKVEQRGMFCALKGSRVEKRVREEGANAAVEISAMGVRLQKFLIALAGNTEVLVNGSAAKLQLENGSVVVIGHAGQQTR